ncbi:WxcM-like, C-terminal [Sphingobacterium nematocida]|uniref:WxcM-like, C-terminal n=1 Tax=Sphingobacterium nematocida TaxID=1513896 RepID=A0A1T5EXR8_9SPHI|nr:FdtA/QdtA family cupin domain-containing protein [Sphingobacterium nematocida]SKB88737.1 WxcM-like, C-terminal [Sphingobacterium nematocida]
MKSPKLIQLPKIFDQRGNLSFFENDIQIPFSIKRTYWISDVPGGETRGGHAFRHQNEFIIALSGSFTVKLHDGNCESTYFLNRSNYGLFVPQMFWREITDFSTNSLALIVSDRFFSEEDYVRDFLEYKNLKSIEYE